MAAMAAPAVPRVELSRAAATAPAGRLERSPAVWDTWQHRWFLRVDPRNVVGEYSLAERELCLERTQRVAAVMVDHHSMIDGTLRSHRETALTRIHER